MPVYQIFIFIYLFSFIIFKQIQEKEGSVHTKPCSTHPLTRGGGGGVHIVLKGAAVARSAGIRRVQIQHSPEGTIRTGRYFKIPHYFLFFVYFL